MQFSVSHEVTIIYVCDIEESSAALYGGVAVGVVVPVAIIVVVVVFFLRRYSFLLRCIICKEN